MPNDELTDELFFLFLFSMQSSRDGGEEGRVVLDALRDLKRDPNLGDFQIEEEEGIQGGRNAIKNALFIGHDSVRLPVTLAILTGSKMEEEEESPLSLWRVALPLARFRDESVGGGNGGECVTYICRANNVAISFSLKVAVSPSSFFERKIIERNQPWIISPFHG